MPGVLQGAVFPALAAKFYAVPHFRGVRSCLGLWALGFGFGSEVDAVRGMQQVNWGFEAWGTGNLHSLDPENKLRGFVLRSHEIRAFEVTEDPVDDAESRAPKEKKKPGPVFYSLYNSNRSNHHHRHHHHNHNSDDNLSALILLLLLRL